MKGGLVGTRASSARAVCFPRNAAEWRPSDVRMLQEMLSEATRLPDLLFAVHLPTI